MTAIKAVLSILLFFITISLQAQPGGGGGLTIHNIYNSKGIKISDDPTFKARAFVLSDSSENPSILEESYDIEEKFNSFHWIRLKPQRLIPKGNNARLLLEYKGDTMVVDFFGIMQSNGMGLEEGLNSLIFNPGYFHFELRKGRKKHEAINKEAIIYKGPADLSFLLEKNLPISYHLRKSQHLLYNKQPLSALEEVRKASIKNTTRSHGGILQRQYEIYKELEQYDKSIDAISKLIKGQIPVTNDDTYRRSLVDDYLNRINLFNITGQPRKALKDYTEIIRIYPIRVDVSYYVTQRAALKIEDLSDYEGAIKDLKSILDTITIDNSGYLMNNPSLSDEYFLLGLAEYKRNNLQLAFKYWCKNGEFGKSGKADHFDSLIVKHPGAAELYLARAMDLYYERKANNSETQNVVLEKALQDLQSAEKFGLSDFRINLSRAGILNRQKKYDRALAEIAKAIEKNPTDPRMYWHRSLIKSNQNSGKRIYSDQDPDMIKYNELKKSWVFERY